MIEVTHRSRVVCRLCNETSEVVAHGFVNEAVEREIDAEAVRGAKRAGILPVELPHMKTSNRYLRNPWICRACADCVLRVFSIDGTITTPALPEAT